jgi:peptide/nickel transport system permease protein
MTEQPDGDAAYQADVYSKDYWDLVFEQLGKRALFKAGMVVLALIYASAIFAPLVANDRPYTIEAVDLKAYKSASGSLRAVAREVGKYVEMSDEAYAEQLREFRSIGGGSGDTGGSSGGYGQETEVAGRTRADAIEDELGAAKQRLATIRLYLPEGHEKESELDSYEQLLTEAVSLSTQGDAEAAKAKADEATGLGRSFRRGLTAWDPRTPDKDGIKLVGAKSHPLWQSLAAKEIFFMVLWLFVLGWPLWNRLVNGLLLGGERDRIRRWRKRKFLAVLGLSTLAALVWTQTPLYGKGGAFDSAPYKSDLDTGTLVLVKEGLSIGAPERISEPTWPPFTFGFSEQHMDATFRPPTWLASAEIDEDGNYVNGARAAAVDNDEQAGATAAVTKIKVLPYEPERNAPGRRLAGTDSLGRDFFTRMLWGGRVSLMVGILSAVLLTVIGVVIGSIAGYFGGWIDTLIMRVIEIIQSLPAFFLILMAMAFTDPEVIHPIFAIVIVIALIRWTGTARLVRGEFLRLREQEFVLAANALGFSSRRTIFRHVLPNAMSPVLVSAAFAVASGILTESAVSYLGFGTRPPEASWGSLVNESKNATFWWVQVFPGILIFITVTCYNLVGDAFRDALDPKMKL